MSNELPVMLLKSFVILPNQEVKLELNNEITKKVVSESLKKSEGKVLVVCPLDQKEESPDVTDLPTVGVLSKIVSKLILPNNNLRITLKGLERVSVIEYKNNDEDSEILDSIITSVHIPKYDASEEEAVKRKLKEMLNNYVNAAPHISNSIFSRLEKCRSLFSMTDMITSFLPLSIEKKLTYMQEINAMYRAKNLIEDINFEIQVLKLDAKIEESLSNDLDEAQKKYLLKEKLREIKKELNEEDSLIKEDVKNFKNKLETLEISEQLKIKLKGEIESYALISEASPEMSIVRTYLETILLLPWNVKSTDETDLTKIKKSLDDTHYALLEVKNRILEYIAVSTRNDSIPSPIICLVGPPGVGKTTLAESIAKSLNKSFAKISVGGLNDTAELIGHRRTYVGASAGKIVNALIKCKTANPVILIDEVDKMVKDIKGDPASALLDILDSNQNSRFIDNYIDEEFDLSKVLFILTANDLNLIPEPLRDRLEIIEIPGYTEFEKIDIANNYIIPRLFQKVNIKNEIKINNDIIKNIINSYTSEAGVRELERSLDKIIRKIITESLLNKTQVKISLKKDDLPKYLGEKKFDNSINNNNYFGTVNLLAYTSQKGLVTQVESTMYDGTGKVLITGLLGDSMKESVDVALSYLKANVDKYEINENYFYKKNIHIHFLSGGQKKDGPSAGVAILTSLISLFTKKKVSKDIALTGELSLRGDALKIGGLKEKIIGAYNSNIKTVIIPDENKAILKELDKRILDNISIITVKNYQEIYNLIFKNEKQ